MVGRILRDCTRGSLFDTVPFGTGRMRMKIQSEPHGDMGSQAEMIWPLIVVMVANGLHQCE